jgi:hypothetical protein
MLVRRDTPVLADSGLSSEEVEDADSPLCVLKAPPGDVDDVLLPILCKRLPAAVTVCDLRTPAA